MDRRPDQRALFETASAQQGYFTASQAAEHRLGTDDASCHVGRGRYVRVLPGVYRLRDYPDSPHGEFMAAWLAMGRDKSDVPRESALDLHGLSDVIPAGIHITVSRTRRNLPRLPGVQIHTTTRSIERRDTAVRKGIRITGPQRTNLDSADAAAGPEQIEMAVRQAVRGGLVDPDELLDNVKERGGRIYRLIQSGLTGIYVGSGRCDDPADEFRGLCATVQRRNAALTCWAIFEGAARMQVRCSTEPPLSVLNRWARAMRWRRMSSTTSGATPSCGSESNCATAASVAARRARISSHSATSPSASPPGE